MNVLSRHAHLTAEPLATPKQITPPQCQKTSLMLRLGLRLANPWSSALWGPHRLSQLELPEQNTIDRLV